MTGFKKSTVARQSSYNSLYVNPLTEMKHNLSCILGGHTTFTDNKENATAVFGDGDKENAMPSNESSFISKNNSSLKSFSVKGNSDAFKEVSNFKSLSTGRVFKQNSLQFCMQMNEPDKAFGSKLWDPIESETSNSLNIWDYSDSEAAPASSWSTLPNRALLCRPLPVDVGRCTCAIVKELSPEGLKGGTLYSLYTNEGQGRKDRKLAVAYHKRCNGKSEFIVAQNIKGVLSNSDDSYLGIVRANLMGSKYRIWDQGTSISSLTRQSNPLLSVVKFKPTIGTWTGSYRSMRAYITKPQSLQLKNGTQVQHMNGLPNDWESKIDKVCKLCTRVPRYNKISRQYELEFRDRARAGLRIRSSVKNFQLTLEENGRQIVLQLGRVDKLKYIMDFRYPLTGYQALCICLASIDSKLCCMV